MFSLWPLLFLTSVSALRVATSKVNKNPGSAKLGSSFKVSAVVNEDNNVAVSTLSDMIYLTNITLGGTSYTVQLDTGSSDLWVRGKTSPVPNSNQSPATANLTYGIGWAAGHISYAPIEFADITVDKQAFVDASEVDNPALRYGAQGILGLGFTSLSTIDATVNSTGSSAGRSLLYNLFAQNPSQPNYISFAFQRSLQPGDDIEGSFGVGEVEDEHKAVLDTPAIPTWPITSPKRWNVLLESIIVGTKRISMTTVVKNAPSNRAVILLDSGSSYTYAPKSIVDEIYASIPGASFVEANGRWSIPCDTEIDMAFQIAGRIFPVHPLDVTLRNSKNQCTGTFVPGSVAVGAGEFDFLVGDNVLRSVYILYDFGDFDSNNNMGSPYVKLLSLVNPNEASSEFVALRGGTAKSNITYNVANDGGADTSSSTISISADVANSLTKMGSMFPIMLAIMGLNALVIIILIVVAVIYLCRRRKRRGTNKIALARTPMGRLSPMPMSTRHSYVAGADESLAKQPHTYEPVSMAITEDTVVPLSPGFRQFDGKPGDRPKSVANLPSHSKLYQQIGSEDALFSPPSPGFAKGTRPNSIASLPVMPVKSSIPEDQPFQAPPIISLEDNDDRASLQSRPSQNGDQSSVHSHHSQRSRHSPPLPEVSIVNDRHSRLVQALELDDIQQPRASFHEQSEEDTLLSNNESASRPQSIVVESNQALLAHDVSPGTPPSTAYYSPTGSQTTITPTPSPPHSGAFSPPALHSGGLVPPTTSGLARPPVPPAFRPRSHLRPNPVATGDRPMSVGILPSQYNATSSSPRVGSSLRPGAHPQSAMRPSSAAFPSPLANNHPTEEEEDITTFRPPLPPFRRMNSSNNGDRPASMA